jgi:hypothetical protein
MIDSADSLTASTSSRGSVNRSVAVCTTRRAGVCSTTMPVSTRPVTVVTSDMR